MRRDQIRDQLFWEGRDDLRHWFAYVNRAPMVAGHVMLANDAPSEDIRTIIPAGMEEAIRTVTGIVLAWCDQHKASGCFPVFGRFNITAGQFRLHILPLSPAEVQEASTSLVDRHPGLMGSGGGGFYYLGQREQVADGVSADLGGFTTTSTLEDLERMGIAQIAMEMRALVPH